MNKKSTAILASAVFSVILLLFFHDAYAQEIVSLTVDVQTILLEPGQIIPLLDTKSVGNVSKLQVSATLPCEGNYTPKLIIVAGALGNLTGVINSLSDYAGLTGSFNTCLFSDTIAPKSNLPYINKVFLKNNGSSSVITNLGTVVTMTGMIPTNETGTGIVSVSDNFNSDNWIHSHANLNINSGVLNWNAKLNTQARENSYRDTSAMLSGLVSDTSYTHKFKLTISNLTQGSNANNIALYVGLSDSTSKPNIAQDFIGFAVRLTSSVKKYEFYDTDGASLTSSNPDDQFSRVPSAETLYVKIQRTSVTSYTVSLYSDPIYATLLDSKIGTSSTTQGLRYFYVGIMEDANTDHTLSGTIDDMTLDTKPT